ncbi:GNAT family N-acetyltransferase [Staphylococcus kloosii]|uniref:GNAT family N-acetyltransferase n=1 Tax=Staphylococcus kloosii TaxID=29384 RepID=UPI0028A52213|nr:GNAT family N-acetyltransferase [Staphylococcus kloosii]MDT3958405.1 GNAT family N-acetyltransferase [Staphylococcus kloosii]
MNLSKISLQEQNYPTAMKIWEKSINASHDFLKESDKLALKSEIPTYFKYVNAYLWFNNDEVIGFSGTNEQNLEMLFLDPKHFGNGYGTKILQYLIKEEAIKFVDVNKDNDKALKFYQKNGFEIYSESQKDAQKRNYPILHLKL